MGPYSQLSFLFSLLVVRDEYYKESGNTATIIGMIIVPYLTSVFHDNRINGETCHDNMAVEAEAKSANREDDRTRTTIAGGTLSTVEGEGQGRRGGVIHHHHGFLGRNNFSLTTGTEPLPP